MVLSGELQAAHGTAGGSEFLGFDVHPLQHGYEEVWQWIVALRIECQVLSVPEAPSGKQGGQIQACMSVRVPEVGSINDHRSVQQGFAIT